MVSSGCYPPALPRSLRWDADARTCCLNPATSTHRQMTDQQLQEAGVPAELVRMSCGLESKEDLIADIAQALDAI